MLLGEWGWQTKIFSLGEGACGAQWPPFEKACLACPDVRGCSFGAPFAHDPLRAKSCMARSWVWSTGAACSDAVTVARNEFPMFTLHPL